jgi:hypothetical protein
MSRASIITLLSLDRWANILGLNPWHFAQSVNASYPAGECDDLLFQWDWIASDKTSRETIANAIAQAEADIAQGLGYWPAPKYFAAEEHEYARYHARELYGWIRQPRGDAISAQLKWGKVQDLGVESKSLILADRVVTVASGTATVTCATTVTEPTEIAVYFRVVDGADAAASETYRIHGGHKPLTISISGGTATISGPAYLFLKPTLQEEDDEIDADAAASYVTHVDVYRRRTVNSTVATLVWRGAEVCGDEACAEETQVACGTIRQADLGIVAPWPATYDSDTEEYTAASLDKARPPNAVRVSYLAGEPLGADGEMADYWARAVAYYAASLLDRPLCACATAKAKLDRWQEDLALNLSTQSGARSFQLDDIAKSCPFGTRRGAVFAWQRVRERQVGRGGIL